MYNNNKINRLGIRWTISILSVLIILTMVLSIGCARKSGVTRTTPEPTQPKETVTPSPTPPPTVETVPPKPTPTEETIPGEDASKPPTTQTIADLGAVYFDFDSADLSADARDTLSRNAQWLRDNQNVRIRVEGHCDERGTIEYNQALGQRRANAVRDYLSSLGIPPNRIQTISFGKERPLDPGHDEDAWAKNRRADSAKIVQ